LPIKQITKAEEIPDDFKGSFMIGNTIIEFGGRRSLGCFNWDYKTKREYTKQDAIEALNRNDCVKLYWEKPKEE